MYFLLDFFTGYTKQNYPKVIKYTRSKSDEVDYQGFVFDDGRAYFDKNGATYAGPLTPVTDLQSNDARSPKLYYLRTGAGGEVWKLWDQSRYTSYTSIFVAQATTVFKFTNNFETIAWPNGGEGNNQSQKSQTSCSCF